MREIVQSDSFVEQVYEILRRHIVSMNLRPGEKLGVEQLASSLGVSRTPVREALNLLSREGLVTVRPRVGYYAVELCAADVREICDVRKMIELYSLERAAAIVPHSVWKDLIDRNESLVHHPESQVRSQFAQVDRDLHKTIIHAVENRRLQEIADQIWAFVDLMFNMNKRIQEAAREHTAILDALCKSDLDLAKQNLALHIDNVCEAIVRHL